MQQPTEKQLNFIKEIEKVLRIKFSGKTKRQAIDFIKTNYAEFKRAPKPVDYHLYVLGFRN